MGHSILSMLFHRTPAPHPQPAPLNLSTPTPPPVDAFQHVERVERAKPHPTLTRVDDFLWRGKQPKPAEFAGLAQQGFRSVINLRDSPNHVESDRRATTAAGMNYLSIQVKNGSIPKSPSDVKAFLDFMTDPANQPAYLHCLHGEGRTGVFAACYRMAIPDPNKLDELGKPRPWTVAEALKEAADNGLTPSSQQGRYIQNFPNLMRQPPFNGIDGYPLKEPLPFGPAIEHMEGYDINEANRPAPILSERLSVEDATDLAQQLYTNFFGRELDSDPGLRLFVPMIEAGRLSEVARCLSRSPAYRDPAPTEAELTEGLSPDAVRVLYRLGLVSNEAPIPTTMEPFPIGSVPGPINA